MLEKFIIILKKDASIRSRKTIISTRGHSSSLDQKIYWKGQNKQEEGKTRPHKSKELPSNKKTTARNLSFPGILSGNSRGKARSANNILGTRHKWRWTTLEGGAKNRLLQNNWEGEGLRGSGQDIPDG